LALAELLIDPHIFAFPLSAILAAALILCVILLKGSSVARIAMDRIPSTVMICLAAILLAIEGTWVLELYHNWFYVILILLLMFSLGFTAMADWKSSSICGFLSHLGLFLVLSGGLFGSADETSVYMTVFRDSAEHMATDCKGAVVPVPFDVALEEFSIDYYDDGASPKQFTSSLLIDGQQMQTSVNHPCRHHGYRIYQSGYDMDYGNYSVLKIVHDPWIGVLAIGALLLTAGALYSLRKAWNSWKILIIVVILAVDLYYYFCSQNQFRDTYAGAPQPLVHPASYNLHACVCYACIVADCRNRITVYQKNSK
jgi:ResB protein required for cytochrome c biosynthesis